MRRYSDDYCLSTTGGSLGIPFRVPMVGGFLSGVQTRRANFFQLVRVAQRALFLRDFLMRFLRYLSGGTLSPVPAGAGHLMVKEVSDNRNHSSSVQCALVANTLHFSAARNRRIRISGVA